MGGVGNEVGEIIFSQVRGILSEGTQTVLHGTRLLSRKTSPRVMSTSRSLAVHLLPPSPHKIAFYCSHLIFVKSNRSVREPSG